MRRLELIWLLVAQELKIRYAGSILGALWVLVKPLLLSGVLYFVFSRVFAPGDRGYAIRLLAGIVAWNLFAEASMLSITSLVSKAQLITRMPAPMPIVVVAAALSAVVNFAMNFLVLLLFASIVIAAPTPAAVASALATSLVIVAIGMSAGFFLSPLFVRFRDLNQIWEVILAAGFYLTPIIYPISLIPAAYRPLAVVNPLAYPIAFIQSAVSGRPFEGWGELAASAAFGAAALVAAAAVFSISSRRSAERL